MLNRIRDTFTDSIQMQIAAADALPDIISKTAQLMVSALLNGNKILACGNGTAAANSSQFVSNMVNRFETERPSLPAFSLNADLITTTAIANDQHPHEIYAKQIRALGQSGDILLIVTEEGANNNLLKAIEAAFTREMHIIVLSGLNDNTISDVLRSQDINLKVPADRPVRINEIHLLTLHMLCDLIDQTLFPQHGA
jgi:DnaA initiator-associating protein